MITAKYGSKKFKVEQKTIYTPDGFSISEALNTEETEVSGKKPTLNIKGIGLKSITFDVKLNSRFVTINSEINFWRSMMVSKKAYSLTLGTYNFGNFVVTEYSLKDFQMNKKGVFTSATLTLKFTEKGTKATAKASTSNGYVKKVTVSLSGKKAKKKIRNGSTVKPVNKYTRMYTSAKNAINKKGSSKVAKVMKYKVTSIYMSGNAAIEVSGTYTITKKSGTGKKKRTTKTKKTITGWMRPEDLKLIKY